ncbi:MAG: hypothetical protein U0Q16_36240 [Bryobacteraceae bacterium]
MKRTFLIAALAGLASLAGASEYERKPDRTSAAGLMLEEVDLQTDAKQRLTLLESFVAKYPKHASAPWAFDQIRAQAIADGKWDTVAEISARMLEVNAEDPWSAQALLDANEKSGDPAKVLRAVETAEAVSEQILAGKTKQKDESVKRRQEAARKLTVQTEAVRLRLLLKEADARRRLTVLESFEKRYPRSAVAANIPVLRAMALWEAGDSGVATAAQDAVKRMPESEDAQFAALASSIAQDAAQDNLVAQSLWLLEMMQRKTKPDCASEADWNRKRDLYVRTAHVALGLAAFRRGDRHMAQRSFAAADVFASDDADAKALLDSLVEGKGEVIPRAVALARPSKRGFDPRPLVEACLAAARE